MNSGLIYINAAQGFVEAHFLAGYLAIRNYMLILEFHLSAKVPFNCPMVKNRIQHGCAKDSMSGAFCFEHYLLQPKVCFPCLLLL